MVAASRFHLCISVARSTLAVWRTMRGAMGAWMSEETSLLHPACGSGGPCSYSFAAMSHGRSGPAPRIMVGCGQVRGPTHRAGWRRTVVRGSLGRAWRRATGPIRAPTPRPLYGPPMRSWSRAR